MLKGTVRSKLVTFKVLSLSSNFGGLLEMQTLQPLCLFESETLEGGPQTCVLKSLSGDSDDQYLLRTLGLHIPHFVPTLH